MQAVVFIVGNIDTKVLAGDHQEIVDDILYDYLSTPVLDDMRYTDSYKKGMIDGKIHVYNRTNKTFHSGLLEVSKIILETQLYQVSIMDTRGERLRGMGNLNYWNEEYQLRNYQFKALRRARERNGILQLPTGGGKTIIAGKIIKYVNTNTCFMVHTNTLLYQTHENFENFFNTEIGIIGDGQCKIRQINVCSIQTLASVLNARHSGKQVVKMNHKTGMFDIEHINVDTRRMDKIMKLFESTDLIIFDECHHLSAETFTEVARNFKNASWRFGLSATVWRADKKEIMLNQLLGPIIYELPIADLIEKGYLVRPQIEFIELLTTVRMGNKYSKKLEKEYFVYNMDRNNALIKKVEEVLERGYNSILIIAQFVDHVSLLEAMLFNKGIKVKGITGKTKKKDRDAILEQFRGGGMENIFKNLLHGKELNVLIATDMFGEGFDMPKIDCIIMAQMGKSVKNVYQYIGRALRPSGNKDHALIVDVADNYRWFSDWFAARLGVYATEESFFDNIQNDNWKKKAKYIGTDVDRGETRIIKNIKN